MACACKRNSAIRTVKPVSRTSRPNINGGRIVRRELK